MFSKSFILYVSIVYFVGFLLCCAKVGHAQDGVFTAPTGISAIPAFSQPTIPCGPTSLTEDNIIGDLLQVYSVSQSHAHLNAIVTWARENRHSAWAPSIFLNAGHAYYQAGYFSSALESWQLGWDNAKLRPGITAHFIADACFGEWVRMLGRIGRTNELDAAFSEITTRTLIGPGATIADHARDGLWSMKNNPSVSFKCGPMALGNVRKALGVSEAMHDIIVNSESTSQGFSLGELGDMATSLGMSYKPVRRVSSPAEYAMPAIVHWKLGHYGALIRKDGNQYLLQDPTFGDEVWMSRNAIETEASGYFIIDAASQSVEYLDVSTSESLNIRGKGFPDGRCPDATGCEDVMIGGCNSCCPGLGKSAFGIHAVLASPSVGNNPIGYSPPFGPSVNFSLTYNYKEYNLPNAVFYRQLGLQTNHSWLSYLQDNPNQPTANVRVFLDRGGSEVHSDWSAPASAYRAVSFGSAKLKRVNSAPIQYERISSDGWTRVYGHVVSSVANNRYILMTALVDPQGLAITFEYDSSHRLIAVRDAQGKVTTICYGLDSNGSCVTTSNMFVRKITDPYGRSASFDYDTTGRLTRVIDMFGGTTQYSYDAGNFMTSMETAYGVTTFAMGSSGNSTLTNWVEVTDPYGEKERVEYIHQSTLPNKLDEALLPLPGTVAVENKDMNAFTTFYWNKLAMRLHGPNKLSAAEQVMFLETQDYKVSRVRKAIKKPFENYVFFNYPNQTNFQQETTLTQPSKIARQVEGGGTQFVQIEYNTQGNVIATTDPLQRTTFTEYDASGLLPTRVLRKTSSGPYAVLGRAEYNSSRSLTKSWDAAGSLTEITYNANSQPTSIKNPLNETTTIDYSTTGLVNRISSPLTGFYTEFAYDNYDRVTSATEFPSGYTMRYEYDIWDRPTRAIYPDGTYEQAVYDKLNVAATRDRMGQWTQMTHSLLGQVESVTNPAGETVQFNWCSCGALDRLVDANGRITAWYRDIQGRVTKHERPDLTATQYEYDTFSGRLKTVTDARNQKTNLTYNIDNSVAAVTFTNRAADVAPVTNLFFSYDADFGRPTSLLSAGIQSINYVPFNPNDSEFGDGRIKSYTTTFDGVSDFQFTYDRLGRIKNQQIADRASAVSFDVLGRVTTATSSFSDYTFDYLAGTGQLKKVTSSNGQYTELSYKSLTDDLLLNSIENRDASGNLISKFGYDYNKLGQITNWTIQQADPTPDQLSMKYDGAGRLTQLIRKRATASTLANQQWNWRFDRAGNRLNEQFETYFNATGTDQLRHEQYSVNHLDQVKSTATGGALHVTANLPGHGFVRQADPPASTHTPRLPGGPFVPSDSATSVGVWLPATSVPGQFAATLRTHAGTETTTLVTASANPAANRPTITYDLLGNITRVVTAATASASTRTVDYGYDQRNRLVRIETDDNLTEITYDGMSRMVGLKETDTLFDYEYRDSTFLWSGLSLVLETDFYNYESRQIGDGIARRFYPGGEEIFETRQVEHPDMAEYTGFFKYHYTRDHLGSIREVVREEFGGAGNSVVARFDYDPYGKVHQIEGSWKPTFLYTGHFYHAPTGLHLAPFRAYDPTLGRWLNRDPIDIAGGMNLYGYVGGDPIDFSDPLGHLQINVHLADPGWYGIRPNRTKVGKLSDLSVGAQSEISNLEAALKNPNSAINNYFNNLCISDAELADWGTPGKGPQVNVYPNLPQYKPLTAGEYGSLGNEVYIYTKAFTTQTPQGYLGLTMVHELAHHAYDISPCSSAQIDSNRQSAYGPAAVQIAKNKSFAALDWWDISGYFAEYVYNGYQWP